MDGAVALLAAYLDDGGDHAPADADDDAADEDQQRRHQQLCGQHGKVGKERAGPVSRGFNDVAELIHHAGGAVGDVRQIL